MNIEEKSPSGVPDEMASGEQGNEQQQLEQQKKDVVAYETYRKTVRAEKAAKERLAQLEAENEVFKQSKLEAEGKYHELNEQLKKRASEAEEARKRDAASFIQAQLSAQLEVEGMKHGCVDSEALLSFADLGSLVEEVDERYRAPVDKVAAEVERIRKAKAYLFQKQAPSINGGLPKGPAPKDEDYASALKSCKTQREFDAVRKKYGRS